jgi:hypothetical protein
VDSKPRAPRQPVRRHGALWPLEYAPRSRAPAAGQVYGVGAWPSKIRHASGGCGFPAVRRGGAGAGSTARQQIRIRIQARGSCTRSRPSGCPTRKRRSSHSNLQKSGGSVPLSNSERFQHLVREGTQTTATRFWGIQPPPPCGAFVCKKEGGGAPHRSIRRNTGCCGSPPVASTRNQRDRASRADHLTRLCARLAKVCVGGVGTAALFMRASVRPESQWRTDLFSPLILQRSGEWHFVPLRKPSISRTCRVGYCPSLPSSVLIRRRGVLSSRSQPCGEQEQERQYQYGKEHSRDCKI